MQNYEFIDKMEVSGSKVRKMTGNYIFRLPENMD